MPPFNLDTCARPNILTLKPYRCARDDYADNGTNILLDANENAYGPCLSPNALSLSSSLHRYPDPHQRPLKQLLCNLRNSDSSESLPLTPDHLFLGVGSDEAIDALLRCFCEPGRDRILTCPPTYGMYAVSAHINNVAIHPVPLLDAPSFALDLPAIYAALDASATSPNPIKLIYLCSPGNPTASLLPRADIEHILAHPSWNGILILDEAYIDFAPDASSLAPLVSTHQNLVVMQTLSKAFGLAAIRLGAAFASPPVATLLNSLKAPYNISAPTSNLAVAALSPDGLKIMHRNRCQISDQRNRLLRQLPSIPGIGRLRGGTDANFLLYEILGPDGSPDNATAQALYERLAQEKGLVVRFRGNEHGCLACLRITIGTADEVTCLLDALRSQLADIRGTSQLQQ
ncbi:hypothetical protein CDD82_5441 [Ophiocordyceps australis]|uniref:histidinol-phosphate transaminase n=1 Tax=Ophiocordyceps australis TaxID=1399860 RepID=A0A2C5ZV20_9HYPO|nr:hypothetical protein CDD82_5441 [Ophiocordyceps australis]